MCKTHFPRSTPTDTPQLCSCMETPCSLSNGSTDIVHCRGPQLLLLLPLTDLCRCFPAQLVWPSQLLREAVESLRRDQGNRGEPSSHFLDKEAAAHPPQVTLHSTSQSNVTVCRLCARIWGGGSTNQPKSSLSQSYCCDKTP